MPGCIVLRRGGSGPGCAAGCAPPRPALPAMWDHRGWHADLVRQVRNCLQTVTADAVRMLGSSACWLLLDEIKGWCSTMVLHNCTLACTGSCLGPGLLSAAAWAGHQRLTMPELQLRRRQALPQQTSQASARRMMTAAARIPLPCARVMLTQDR